MTRACRHRRPVSSLALACLLAVSLQAALPPSSRAQEIPVIDEREAHYDYYTTDTNADARRYVALAEQYHLTNTTFWERYRAKDWVRARNELIFILRIAPNHPKALYLLEAVASQTEDVAYPIAYYEYALRLYPLHAITRARYGRFLARIGKREAGIAQLEHALTIDPALVVARGWLDDARHGREPQGPRQLPGLTP